MVVAAIAPTQVVVPVASVPVLSVSDYALESPSSPVTIHTIKTPPLTDKQKVREIESVSVKNTLWCESQWKQFQKDGSVVRGKAGEYGIAQFMGGTWKNFNTQRMKEGFTSLDIMKTEDQLTMITWAFSKGYESHWTCWRMHGHKTFPIYPASAG